MRRNPPTQTMDPAIRALLLSLFETAVAASQPGPALKRALDDAYLPSVHVLSVGKAGLAMAQAAADYLPNIERGLAISHVDAPPPNGFDHILAEHPVPGPGSVQAGEAALSFVRGLSADDVLLVLLSGGSSSLMNAPVEGITLGALQTLTKQMLASGAPISDINCVRRHLSRIKGGRLTKTARPARVVTLAISDVVGDHPADIGSGPTVGDATTLADARQILDSYKVSVVEPVKAALTDPSNETMKPDDPCFNDCRFQVIVSARHMLQKAADMAERANFTPVILGEAIEGDAEQTAREHAALALQHATRGERVALLSGGELTMTLIDRAGAGGPNQHYALTLANAVKGHPGIFALAADTDGKDGVAVGTEDHAGGVIGPETMARLKGAGVNLGPTLAKQDSGTALGRIGDALITGATGTNVNDFRVILIDGQRT